MDRRFPAPAPMVCNPGVCRGSARFSVLDRLDGRYLIVGVLLRRSPRVVAPGFDDVIPDLVKNRRDAMPNV
jgi:hypothetical protein